MFEIDSPRTTKELRAGLVRLHREIGEAVGEMSTEEFLAPQGQHWSPAEHLRHLVTANRMLAAGLKTPKILLTLRFGRSRVGSQSYEEVRSRYRGALAAGGRASGRYDPSERTIDKEPEVLRRWIMKRWDAAGRELEESMSGWSDTSLDRQQAKHPLLGVMTARELLYFTLYHNAHHARRIAERRQG